jgi:hypothetical protein
MNRKFYAFDVNALYPSVIRKLKYLLETLLNLKEKLQKRK